jgi:enoyl-CoA hydratase/carnithine racemase
MSDGPVLCDRRGSVAVLTLHRPAARNAYTAAMGSALAAAYADCDADDAVRAVVITGTPPAFCAGADLSRGAQTFTAIPEDFSATPPGPLAHQIRKPVIAAMNGHAVGIGFTLALHADIRLVADDARYGVVQVRRGMMPDAQATGILPRLIGMAAAAEVLLTGRMFDGPEAVRLGLAVRSLPADAVLPAAVALAEEIAAAAPLSAAFTKHTLWWGLDHSLAAVGRRESDLHRVLMAGPDAREGGAAAAERRDPRWIGSVSRDWPAWLEEDT